jgi:hypothetical protein
VSAEFTDLFHHTAYLILFGSIAGALFFAMAGIRELVSRELQGIYYCVLAMFFTVIHFLYLANLPADLPTSALINLSLWSWINLLVAPALIGLFILYGIFRLLSSSIRPGLVKLFFGLTLLCYLYMLGPHWPADVKGILTIVWSGAWFEVGLRTA